MRALDKDTWRLGVVFTAACVTLALAQGHGNGNGSSGIGLSVKPEAVQKRATLPPPLNARQARTIGKGSLKVSTANSPGDTDSFWTEQIDVDGNGNVDEASLIWDDEDKVLYTYTEGTFTCKNGATDTGALLVAAYGTDNSWQRPPGSGFWVASLDKGQCGLHTTNLWGCKFDAKGNASACGAATVDAKNGDIAFATASTGSKQ